MEVYLDNSATTRCFPEVAELTSKIMCEDYGNPSSMHMKGVQSEQYIRYAKETFARLLKVQEKEIFFTSGGTESDNMAVLGCTAANYRAGKHLITTRIEHPAVLEPMKYLERQGFDITWLGVDENGVVRPEDVRSALRPDTILVSVMHTNNEVGSLQPVAEIGSLLKQYNPKILFHVDAVQGFGKFIVFGGGQQKGVRSGTENVPGIAGMAKAAELVYANLEEDVKVLYELRQYFVKGILKMDGVQVNGLPGTGSAPHVVSVSVRGVRSEVLLHALEDRGIFVSAGSACASNHPKTSETLKAMNLEKDLLGSTIRFSFSVFTTKQELDYTLQAMYDMIPMLRRYGR